MRKLSKKEVRKGRCFTTQARDGIVWKKLKDHAGNHYLCEMVLKKGTRVYIGLIDLDGKKQKMRAERALVKSITLLEEKRNPYWGTRDGWQIPKKPQRLQALRHVGICISALPLFYMVGQTVKPNKFSREADMCSEGIHFFQTKEEAINYW